MLYGSQTAVGVRLAGVEQNRIGLGAGQARLLSVGGWKMVYSYGTFLPSPKFPSNRTEYSLLLLHYSSPGLSGI